MYKKIFFLFILIFIISCTNEKRDWNNPFDPTNKKYTPQTQGEPSQITLISNSFENGFSAFNYYMGTPSISTNAHLGTNSYTHDELSDCIRWFTPGNKAITGRADIYFYDNNLETKEIAFTILDSISYIHIIITGAYPTKYCVRNGSPTVIDSGIDRSQGWHKFIYIADGATCKVFIDNMLVLESMTLTTFNNIIIGDQWGASICTNYAWDDFKVIQYK